jgi:hypothetical protein
MKPFSLVIAALALLLGACGPAGRAGPTTLPVAPAVSWSGTVRFEARSATPRGLSLATELRAARFVDVVARDVRGVELARTATDAAGAFTLAVPPAATALVLVAHARLGAIDVSVASDPLGRTLHEVVVPLAGLAPRALELVARDDDRMGSGGAFHILDTLLRGLDAASRWSAQSLPPLFVYWSRGGPSDWSYYRGERPAGSGRFALELMGGEPGRLLATDTDEHDEAIILHEVGHFIFDRLSTDSSIGGLHPAGTLIDPGVAWEEGRATWFAAAVLGRPLYQDTIGREPNGSLRVDHDLERGIPGPVGAGSEMGVSEVLWDLTDGIDGIPDSDNDGVALGPEAVLRAMIALGREPGALPELAGFLRYLVRSGAVGSLPLKQMLARGTQPPSMVPDGDDVVWPRTLALPGRATGTIDGLTSPAPSGGPPRPENGFDAVHVYRVHVERPGFLVVRLDVLGSGRAAEHQDLDLELRSIRTVLIVASRGETPNEHVGRVVEPGWYTIYVRDGGHGNRVSYELSAVLE